MRTTMTTGALVSYRYMLTPRSALELNYGFAQNTICYTNASFAGYVHSRQEEISAAYVYCGLMGGITRSSRRVLAA